MRDSANRPLVILLRLRHNTSMNLLLAILGGGIVTLEKVQVIHYRAGGAKPGR